jgi:transmembrane sensor
MNPDSRSFLKKSPDEQADHWLALLNSPLADQAQQRAFQIWLNKPENGIAWQKAQSCWQQLDGLSSEQIQRLEQHLAVSTPTIRAAHFAKRKSVIRPWLTPVFACLLVAVSFGVAKQSGYFADYRTAQGEQRQVQLDDGSTVLLNTASSLSIDYSPQRRTVILHDGEAYFTVAADAGRPFTVSTKTGQVTALGTAFDVKQLDDAMTVTVSQHSVRVDFKQGAAIERLQEGERVAYREQQVSPVTKVNLKQAGAWQQHRLIFTDQPLQQVIAELNRYRSGNIVILDRRLAAHRVNGVFDSQDTESALATIEKTLAIKEVRLTDLLVILVPAKHA